MDCTQKNVKNFWTVLICVGCLLIAWNVHLMMSECPRILLALLPEEIEIQEALSEGTEFQTEFTFENKTRSDMTIKKLQSSCGCTALFTKDGQPIAVPLVLPPSKSFPVQVVVDTKHKTGKNVASIMVQYEYKGEPFMLVGKILFDVMPALKDDDHERSEGVVPVMAPSIEGI